jgi:uncharacterized membrane protein
MIHTNEFHPMLVHFPVALLLIGLLADISSLVFKKEMCLSKAGLYLLIAGTLFVVPTVLSGLFFTPALGGEAGDLKEKHEHFALITLSVAILTSVFRVYLAFSKKENTNLKWPALGLYILTSALAGITGYLGGILVYRHLIT